jgi:type I restriction enzyme M protein
MTDTNQKQLGNTLWSIADQLRGAMDADDFRDLAFMTRRIEENHFRGVTKMVAHLTTQPLP